MVGEEMCFGLATFVKINSRAHTLELRATCWAFLVGLEHAERSLPTKESSWKRRMQLGWGMWQQQAKKIQNMMILFHFLGIHLLDLVVGLKSSQQKRGQPKLMVQWTKYFIKRHDKRLILPFPSFSISTSFHSMLHGQLCSLRCVDL